MMFSDNIPERVKERVNSRFFDVLDALLAFKEAEVMRTLRVHNPSLLNDNKWIIKKLADYGLTGIPQELPTAILQQVLLNVGNLLRTRGSKIGVELFCSVFSLGEVSIDDSEYYAESGALIPNSKVQGFITADSSDAFFFIIDKTEDLVNVDPLYVYVSSPYFATEHSENVKAFLENTIDSWLGFNPGKKVNFVYSDREKPYFHKLLNPYFV